MANFGLYNKNSIFKTFGDEYSRYKELSKQISNNLRVCIPAKIISIDYDKMTCQCQPLIREKMRLASGEYYGVDLPLLLDVPIVYPGSTDFSITFPISVDDEGLVIFSDMCIDAWWQSGDIQDQFEVRRHDLSDGFFIPTQLSQPKKYSEIDQENLEIRFRSTKKYLKLGADGVSTNCDIVVDGKSIKDFMNKYNAHTHSAPADGGTTSGPNKII